MHIQAQILLSKVPITSLKNQSLQQKSPRYEDLDPEAIGYSSIDSLSKTIKTYQVVEKITFLGTNQQKRLLTCSGSLFNDLF